MTDTTEEKPAPKASPPECGPDDHTAPQCAPDDVAPQCERDRDAQEDA